MAEHYLAEELDADTVKYLKRVAAKRGKGVYGRYAELNDYRPLWAFICGLVILISIPVFTIPPIDDDPTNTAFLQTGPMLLGGWLVVAALRVWLGGGLGKFLFADACYLWVVKQRGVDVYDLEGLRGADADHSYHEESYTGSKLNLRTRDGEETISLNAEHGSEAIAAFLRKQAKRRRRGEEDEDDPADRVPEPRRARRVGGPWVGLGVTLGSGLLMFLLLDHINTRARDHKIYELVKNQSAPWLRRYLLDPRCTRHTGEVQRKLDGKYTNALLRWVRKGNPLNVELLNLVARLRFIDEYPQPVVSIRAQSSVPGVDAKALRRLVADGLTAKIGKLLVGFVEPPDGAKAMVEINVKPTGDGNRVATIAIRRGPDEKVRAAAEVPIGRSSAPAQVLRALGF